MTGPEVHLVALSDDDDGLTIGGKAEGLRRLRAADMPVPIGVVIPAEALDSDLHRLSGEVADRFSGRQLAVRSSCVAEDRTEASFAGQYETVLGVSPQTQDIVDAAQLVRSSVGADRVGSYTGAHSELMAVLIMPMIDADLAGVAFTRDPVTGERCVVVEAVRGLGDKLASGEAVGERWKITDTAECLNDLNVLVSVHARAIAELARRCEVAMECPQDIEWAIAEGEVVLLQSRPITTLGDVDPIPINDEIPPGPWEWDSTHNRLPMTPLSVSSFGPGFAAASRRLAETYGAPISHLEMRAINGYLYIQVVPPMGKAGQPAPPKLMMRTLFRIVPLLRQRHRSARHAWNQRIDRKLLGEWRTDVRRATEATLDDWYDLDVSSLSNEALSDSLMKSVQLQRDTFSWNMVTDPAYLIPLAMLHDFVEEQLNGGMEITTRLLAGASPSEYRDSTRAVSSRLSDDVRRRVEEGGGVDALDPDGAATYERHLRAHGQKIIGFDLSNHTYLENPDLEITRIATMPLPRDPSPGALELAATLRATLDADGASRFDALLQEARSVYPIREEGEAVHSRVMGCVRLFALEVGDRMVSMGQLDDREHIMFLTIDEITEWLRSHGDLDERVRTRRGQHQWAKGQSPAPFLGPESPMPDIGIFPPDVQRIMRVVELIQTHDARPAVLTQGKDGVAASPGTYTGPVRLVEGPHEFDKVQPGDVLVAPLTMSPWEVLFPHLGALVTEGGGLLSHPAIVAREYALPAVVGCEGAMSRFHDGQIVRVDGAAGTVTAIEGQPNQPD